MKLARGLVLFSLVALTACESDGPPRPDGTAPFPMPNPRSSGLPHPHSYEESAEGELVLDEVTGLEWQRTPARGPGDEGGFVRSAAGAHCEELVQEGHDDFYLPSRLELVSILDPSRTDPAIDEVFEDTAPRAFWSSTVLASDAERSYDTHLALGETGDDLGSREKLVRCVRNERQPELSSPEQRFRVEGGTVLDRLTGLRWQRETPERADTFERMRAYCGELIVDANPNFRMPSVKELESLVDDSRPTVLLDPVAFPNASGVTTWSSSRYAGETEAPENGDPERVLAWSVRFSDGHSQLEDVNTENHVRCVR